MLLHAILLAIVGVFGTWRTAGPVSLNGLEGPHNGWMVIIFALISLAGVGAPSRGSWLGIVTVLGCAAAMIFARSRTLLDDNAVLGGSSGWGVWLTIAGVRRARRLPRSRGRGSSAPRL